MALFLMKMKSRSRLDVAGDLICALSRASNVYASNRLSLHIDCGAHCVT